MAIDLRLAGRVLTVTVNGESASIDLANIRGDDGVRGPQGPAGDATSVTALEAEVAGKVSKSGDTMTGSLVVNSGTEWGAVGVSRTASGAERTARLVINDNGTAQLELVSGGAIDNAVILSGDSTYLSKPLSIPGGGTGCATEAELRTYLKTLLGLS